MSLPTSWTVTPLSNLLDQIVGGGTPSKAVSANFIGSVPFMTVKDMKARFIADTVDDISEDAVASSATTKIPADTLVVATRMSLGKIVRPSVEVAINQDLKALFPCRWVDKTYLEYFWRSKSDLIQSQGTGTTVKGIRIEDIKNLETPLAPENEQRRIADKLDTILTRVDALNDRLARITPLLKRFRQSVLAAATSGRLTKDWLGCRDLDAWRKSCELRQVTSVDVGFAFKSAEFKDSGIRLLRGDSIEPGGLRWLDAKYWSSEAVDTARHLFLAVGDVVLAMDRPIISTGLKVARVKAEDLPCLLVQRVCRFRTGDEVTLNYIHIALQSSAFVEHLLSVQNGSSIPHISAAQILSFRLHIPQLEEQSEIVRRVETLFAYADRLEARLQTARTAADRLTPALLAKAFRGELVPQDPNDEPATELLRRLREARASEAPIKKPRGRKAAV